MKTLIVGSGGREAALTWKMAESSQLHAFMSHQNPSIINDVAVSGGSWEIGNILDPESVADFARRKKIDLAVVSADAPLEAGVVDALKKSGIKTFGPTRLGAQIEWDKAYARGLIERHCPEANPQHWVALDFARALQIIETELEGRDFAIKPSGLTGGKGVKVTGVNIERGEQALDYVRRLFGEGHGAVILEESLHGGVEFTIQAITDGTTTVLPPATIDYPYREDGDSGPGTGGMGVLTNHTPNLPFMTLEQHARCGEITRKILAGLKAEGRAFNGVINGGFFVMPDGRIKVIEFNSRFGDPECINIMSLLHPDCDAVEIISKIAEGTLAPQDIKFRENEASVLVYLVAPEYAYENRKAAPVEFYVPLEEIKKTGCRVFFASAEKGAAPDMYRTVGTSRTMAILANDRTYALAADKVMAASSLVQGNLNFRKDVGSPSHMEKLEKKIKSGV